MKLPWQLTIVLVAGASAGSIAASVNHMIFSKHSEPNRKEHLTNPFARTGFSLGTMLADLELTAPDGQRQTLLSLVGENDETVLHFIDRECAPCMNDLHTWGEALEVTQVPLLFVACNESTPVQRLDGLENGPTILYTLLKREPTASGGPRSVPLTIIVDRNGTIIDSLRDVHEFLRRWHRSEDSQGEWDGERGTS